MFEFRESASSTMYYNSISEVLDDIKDKSYLVNQAQIEAIRMKLLTDKTSWHSVMIGLINTAYTLGLNDGIRPYGDSWKDKEQLISDVKEGIYDVEQ